MQRDVNFACWLFFPQISHKPNIDLELDYIFRKPMKRSFQRYTVCMEIMSTFHAQVEYISVKKYAIETTGPNLLQKLPLLRRSPSLSNTPISQPKDQTPPQTVSRSNQSFSTDQPPDRQTDLQMV